MSKELNIDSEEQNINSEEQNIDSEEFEFKLTLVGKKKKKKNIELLTDDNISNVEIPIDVFNDYNKLLDRALSKMSGKLVEKTSFKISPPNIQRFGSKKTIWSNFKNICDTIRRNMNHVMTYFLTECCTTGSFDEQNNFILRGRYDSKQIESILRKYLLEYVKCTNCGDLNTEFNKDSITRLTFIECLNCKSKKSISIIKEGFHATTKSDRKKERNS